MVLSPLAMLAIVRRSADVQLMVGKLKIESSIHQKPYFDHCSCVIFLTRSPHHDDLTVVFGDRSYRILVARLV